MGGRQRARAQKRGAEGAADGKQQPVWVNAVIKVLISSAKRGHRSRRLRERRPLKAGWLCGGRPGPLLPPPRTGAGSASARGRGGRQESWQLPAPRAGLCVPEGGSDPSPPPVPGPVTNAFIVLAPANMFNLDGKPSVPLPKFSKHLHGTESNDEQGSEGVTLRLGLHQQVLGTRGCWGRGDGLSSGGGGLCRGVQNFSSGAGWHVLIHCGWAAALWPALGSPVLLSCLECWF